MKRNAESYCSRTYGSISPDKQNEMTGLEFVQGLADRTLPLNTMARTLGYDITEARTGVSSLARSRRHPPESRWHRARRSRSYDARQLHGARDPLDLGEGRGLHNS